MSFTRGSNPIWTEFDLTGHLFDDTFYLFVLQNDIPYIPATVYHYADGTVPWTQPIQFLANGTLPIDIFFDSDLIYRLEFRQGPTQSDPLIYLVENYRPGGSGGINPPGNVGFSTDNQITNAQFSLINFISPYSRSGITNPSPIEFAPGWFLNLTGTGNVTLTQVSLNNDPATVNPTNAPYALHVELNGTWTNAYISQRFQQNGMLWANKVVSSSLTAKTAASILPTNIRAEMYDSNGNLLGTVLPVTTVTSTFTQFKGLDTLPDTTNPNTPPSAYIEYRLFLENAVDIFLTSFQLVAGDIALEYDYAQDTIDRQIDHTYHYAYPIVPVGSIIDFGGFDIPLHYLLCDGTAYNRIDYILLFNSLTTRETVSLTSTVSTFTVVSSVNYHIGMFIEGNGILANVTITNIVGNTITMSSPASTTVSSLVTFFAWGHGNGTTTFNTPDLRDYVTAGSGGTLFSANNNTVGRRGGSSTHVLSIPEMPSHNHPGSTARVSGFTAGAAQIQNSAALNHEDVAITISPQGGGLPHTIVQQTALVKKCIRYQ